MNLRYSVDGEDSWTDHTEAETGSIVSFPLSSLTAGTAYEVEAWLGSDTDNKVTATFMTIQAAAVTPPSISSVRVLNVTRTSARVVVGLANANAEQRVYLKYKLSSAQWPTTSPQNTTHTNGSATFILSSLTAGTGYHVRVSLNSDMSDATTRSFTTTSPPPPQRSPDNPTPPVTKSPEVSSVTFADIYQTSANATVHIRYPGTSQKTVRLRYRIKDTTWSTPPKIENTRGSSATFALMSLTAGTSYEVQAWLTSNDSPPPGTQIYEFNTLDEVVVADPVISSLQCSNTGQTYATAIVEIADAGTDMKQVFLKHSIQGEDEWTMLPFPTITYDDDTSIPLTGLTEGTTYEVAVALSEDFSGMVIVACTTLPLDPVVSGISVDRRKQTSVWANVSIANANGEGQTVHLRYRTTTPQGEWSDIAETTTSTDSASKEIAGLTADTEYEVQASLDGSFPDDLTKNATFTTLRFPSISNLEVEDETKNSATAVITIADPDGSNQTIHLRYRTAAPQGAWSSTLPGSSTTAEASIGLTALAPDTEYEAEASLTSDFAVAVSDVFRTLPPDPVVSKVSVNSIRQTTATASIDIANANENTQTVSLRYRTTTPRGAWSGIKTATSTTDSASIDLTELTPGTEYDVQASLENSFPSSRTKHDTFTTLRRPSIASFEVENVGRNGATVSATIADSRGVPQTVYVRHQATGYVAWRPTQQVDSVDDIASLRLRGLSSGTEYVAEASSGQFIPGWRNQVRYLHY